MATISSSAKLTYFLTWSFGNASKYSLYSCFNVVLFLVAFLPKDGLVKISSMVSNICVLNRFVSPTLSTTFEYSFKPRSRFFSKLFNVFVAFVIAASLTPGIKDLASAICSGNAPLYLNHPDTFAITSSPKSKACPVTLSLLLIVCPVNLPFIFSFTKPSFVNKDFVSISSR